jgi:hypothetical protein
LHREQLQAGASLFSNMWHWIAPDALPQQFMTDSSDLLSVMKPVRMQLTSPKHSNVSAMV